MNRAVATVGLWPAAMWAWITVQSNLKVATPASVSVKPLTFDHRVRLRAMTSDPFVFRQIAIEQEYLPLKPLDVTTILDLGANVGLSSAWFLSQFPQARVFAVEADADNYAACSANLQEYGERARVLHGAAWSREEVLVLKRRTCAADNVVGNTLPLEGDVTTQGWDVGSLIEKSGFARIDLLKIDIEGAESEVFKVNASSWLPKVRNLCIELHGAGDKEIFFRALEGFDYVHSTSGELDICTGLRAKSGNV